MPLSCEPRRVDEWRVEIPIGAREGMRVPGMVFANAALMAELGQDPALEQVANVATLPGIVGRSFAMPDIHWGYGFPIGGVAAFDAKEGVISPGGVGFDINCGVRLLRTDLREADVRPKLRALVDGLFAAVPSGVGSKARVKLSRTEIDEVFRRGVAWAIDQGYGFKDDVEYIEHNGTMPGADPSKVSEKAITRGMPQAGSLGGGNHFLEIQVVDEIFDPVAAEAFELFPGQVCVMVHCGSRGAGHQICTDYVEKMDSAAARHKIELVDRQLAAAPFQSAEGQDYYHAMCCAVNFAWTNRQMIIHWSREVFGRIFESDPEALGMRLVYDVAHNIAKRETHLLPGEMRRADVVVHRKGATRAFGPGNPDIPEAYRHVGQPVLVPGDMGTASYVLAGTEGAMRETYGSCCHGAGREMSRTKAAHAWRGEDIIRGLAERGIIVRAASPRVAAEEAPDAYKDVSMVVDVCAGAGLGRKVARMRPIGCVKG
ncbi:MAG: RtcB family protein [Thermoplasmatota archaeon]